MKFEQAKQDFIQAWGSLGSSWGINKAMAQIQAVLLISPEPLTTDDIMERLSMSRGNVNMNLRSLMEWGIVYKAFMPGERKDFFKTEKDMWKLMRQIAEGRRKRGNRTDHAFFLTTWIR